MAQTLLRLLLHRRLPLSHHQNLKPHSHHHRLSPPCHLTRPFSAAPSAPSPDPLKPSNLSARLSFVFDQIDKIERERSQKDETLQRIRAWRESKNARLSTPQSPENDSGKETEPGPPSESARSEPQADNKVELVHPWPEWIELMERLVQQNYFDHKRRDEGMMVSALGFDVGEDAGEEEGFDFTKDLKTVQTAGLNFGKDRFDIFRPLSRKDIQILVGYGCPSADKKVVFSAKLLRKHVHLDEGDVCSTCSLRSTCERAYLVTNKEDEARTIDVMRVLMAFGFDHMHGTVTNESVLKQKSVKTVVRKLLHEVVKLSSVPIDPSLPPPIIRKPPPKVKQPPPPPRKRVGRDDVEMKKGDWLCPKCDFMNFAKNAACLQCEAKRPKRQLLPGEWECPECNFLNYRRNVVCFHCECKRPPDQFMEDRLQDTRQNMRTRLEKTARRTEVSNAWNFDFDDDESDGADVAAFENADSSVTGKDFPVGRNFEGPEEDFHRGSRVPNVHDVEYPDFERKGSQAGFDDFDDEDDDDDVDSYEVDSARSNAPSRDFSEFEQEEESEDGGLDDDELPNRGRARTHFSPNKPSKPTRRGVPFSGSDEGELGFRSDEELSAHPGWRSSHVADSGKRNRGRGIQSMRLSYGSDEDLGLDSDDDAVEERFGSSKSQTGNFSGKRRESSRLFSGSEESDDEDFNSRKGMSRGDRGGFGGDRRRGSNFKGNGSRNFSQDMRSGSNGGMGNQRRNFGEDDFDMGPSRGFRGGSRGGGSRGGRGGGSRGGGSRNFGEDDFDMGPSRGFRGGSRGGRGGGSRGGGGRDGSRSFGGRRSGDEGRGRGSRGGGSRGGSRSFGGRRSGDEFGRREHGRSRKYDEGAGGGDDFSNRRRVIER